MRVFMYSFDLPRYEDEDGVHAQFRTSRTCQWHVRARQDCLSMNPILILSPAKQNTLRDIGHNLVPLAFLVSTNQGIIFT